VGRGVRTLPFQVGVTSERYSVDPFAHLNLKDDETGVPDPGLAAGQVELPHTAEALIVDGGDAIAVGHELQPPRRS
jgi:hypothetical protein